MTNAKHNWKRNASIGMMALALTALALTAFSTAAQADPPARVTVTGNVDIHVWLDRPMEVYPSYDDVVLSVRANRGCYASLFVVDTFGYVHVVYPFDPYDDAWITAGATYRFRGCDIGLDRFGDRGIVHVFAIGSPFPFDYAAYGEYVFAGRYGYRIYGDPYVACRTFYVSLLPAAYHWDRVSMASVRFYVREWVRYPAYLCHCSRPRASYVRVDGRCHKCGSIYDTYRVHVSDPRVVLRRAPRYKDSHGQSYAETRMERSERIDRAYKSTFGSGRTRAKASDDVGARRSRIVSAKRTDETVAVNRTRSAEKAKRVRAVEKKSSQRGTPQTSPTAGSRNVKTKKQKGRVSR